MKYEKDHQNYVDDGKLKKQFDKNEDFNSYTPEERNKFFEEILNLRDTLEEVENYRLFESLIKDITEKYKDKDKNKGDFNLKRKNIKKEEKKRIKILKKYNFIKKHKTKKINIIINQMQEQIKLLDSLYKELEQARINEKIYTKINEGSTIYDAVLLINSFHGYLKSLIIRELNITNIKEVERLIKQFDEFTYNPSNIVIKKINLFSECNLEYMINNKCKLFNINIDQDALINNLESIKSDIETICKIYNIETSPISLEDIKFICEVKKI